ncbi:MAG: hypothetical protein CR974_04035 [Gammaproteobacteria bacterium]|nr:MAG: hypothetical protein CR974_04035 [Gammaproteobacteria bacterium]
MINDKDHQDWIIPTAAGMVVASLRRFRRQREETWPVVLARFLSHAGTCVIAGYITAGILHYFKLPNLTAPACALAGLYGTLLVDWVEEDGFPLLTAYVKSRIKHKP